NATAVFTIAFNVNPGAADGEIVTNAVAVSSATHELNASDNSASSSATVFVATNVCSLNCPSSVIQDNDANQCGAVVNYSAPTTSGDCGGAPVICNPPTGAFFPIGVSVVSCSTQTGGTCSFNVTINDTRPPVQPTITCPPNQSVGEDSPGSGTAIVNYPAP